MCAHIICVGCKVHPHEARCGAHGSRLGRAALVSRAYPCAVVSAAFTKDADDNDDGCRPSPALPSRALSPRVLSHMGLSARVVPCRAAPSLANHVTRRRAGDELTRGSGGSSSSSIDDLTALVAALVAFVVTMTFYCVSEVARELEGACLPAPERAREIQRERSYGRKRVNVRVCERWSGPWLC